MQQRQRCPLGHFLPQHSTGYRLREDPQAAKTVIWWLPHEREELLMRVVPHIPQTTEIVLYWVCSVCRKAVAGTEAMTLGEWRRRQQEQERKSA